MNKDVLYQAIKDIYTSNVFNKSALDFRMLIFNENFRSIFKKYNNVSDRMRNIEEIFSLINQYLGVSEVEKKQNGEVFTPFKLINEMLDTLPKEVWSNPDLKWLDPANGIGNFPAVVIQRLMVGLKDWEPNEEKRYKHIIENMIYVCDISPKNMFLYLNIFDPNNEYEMNYHRGSFLEDDFADVMKKWDVEKFDIVVGNPPYQKSGVDKGQGHIYHLFINKSISFLLENSYLLFVNPPTFLKNKIDCIQNKQINFISFDVKKHFEDIGTSFIYFLLINKDKNNKTKIKTSDFIFEEMLKYDTLIPLGMMHIHSFSIIDKIFSIKCRTFDFKRNETPFPKNAAFVRRMNRHQYFNCLKTNDDFKEKPNQDYTTNTDVDNLIFLINSKLYKFLYKCYSTSPFITKTFINSIPFPEINFSKMTDYDIYNYFNLTQEEIDLIESTIK